MEYMLMTWKDKMKEAGGADLLFMSEDGEVVDFIVVGEAQLLKSKYKGKESTKIGAPVVTIEGFSLLIMGTRLARRLTKHEAEFNKAVFRAIRHGVEGDTGTTYELQVLDEKDLFKRLSKVKETEYHPDQIAPAVAAAIEVMNQ